MIEWCIVDLASGGPMASGIGRGGDGLITVKHGCIAGKYLDQQWVTLYKIR